VKVGGGPGPNGQSCTEIWAEITYVKVELWRWRREGGRWTGGKPATLYQDLGRNHLCGGGTVEVEA